MEDKNKPENNQANKQLVSLVSKLLCFIEQADSEKERVEQNDHRN